MAGQAVNEWREIAGSAPSANPPAVDPGPGPISNIIAAWNGSAFDRRNDKVWMARPGGHGDQYYNGVLNFPLGNNAPTMIEVLVSNAAGEISAGNSPRYPNGRPASSHLYALQHIVRARNWLVDVTIGAVASGGGGFPNCEVYDITQTGNAWLSAGTMPNCPASSTSFVCKDEATEDFIAMNDNIATYRWTQATNTWSAPIGGDPPVSSTDAIGAVDTTRNQMFLLKGAANASHTFNLSTLTWTARTLSGAGAAGLAALAKGAGMEYVPAIDAYLVRGGASGGTVYRINASTFEVTTLSTTGGASIPATPVISGNPENVYSRWRLSTNFGRMFILPSYTSNWWCLRVY